MFQRHLAPENQIELDPADRVSAAGIKHPSLIPVLRTLLFAAPLAFLAAPLAAQVRQEESDEEARVAWRFTAEASVDGDMRGLDPDVARSRIAELLGSNPENVQAAKQVYQNYSFEQIEALAKKTQIFSPEHSAGLAEARRQMIRDGLRETLTDFDVEGRYELGVLDSGNKASGAVSDIDQTIFLINKATGDVASSAEIDRFIGEFNDRFTSLNDGLMPERLGIESMNGADFAPDYRQAHSVLEFEVEARRVVAKKGLNPEAYRSEGQLKSQAEGRGYEALREHGVELVRFDNEKAQLQADLDRLPPEANRTPEQTRQAQDFTQRLVDVDTNLRRVMQFSPWTYFSRNEADRVVWDTGDDPRGRVLPVEPVIEQRYAFDGSYDNWFMFENHAGNRPKYLLRSVAEGVGLLSRLNRSSGPGAAVTYDSDPNRRITAYNYDVEYGRGNHDLNRQFVRDVYGLLQEGGSKLTVERVQWTMDAAAKFRLRHKGQPGPDGRLYTVADVYSDYMSDDARYPEQIRLEEAKARWAVDAREIMIENLLLTVKAPGDIAQGKFSAADLAPIRERVRAQAPGAPVDADVLRRAAQLQLYHGIRDLISPEHARELVEPDAARRQQLRSGRMTDLVDRLFEAADAEFRPMLEQIAREAASERVTAEESILKEKASRSYYERLNGIMSRRLLEPGRLAYAETARRYRNGFYSPDLVGRRMVEGMTNRVGSTMAQVLGGLGFEGEVRTQFPEAGDPIRSLFSFEGGPRLPFEFEFGQPAFNGKTLLRNMFSTANFDSGLQVIHAYQYSNGNPLIVAQVAAREIILTVPGMAPGYALYEAVAHGRPQGLAVLGAAMMWPAIGHGFILVNMGTTAVRIGGVYFLDPLKNDIADIVYQGFLEAEAPGLLRAGWREALFEQRDNLLSPVRIRVVPHTRTDDSGTLVMREGEAQSMPAPVVQALSALLPLTHWALGTIVDLPGRLEDMAPKPQTFYALAPYSLEEALEREFVASAEEYAFAVEQGLMGGGPDWEEQFPRALDREGDPTFNREATRSSFYYHYRDRVDQYLCQLRDSPPAAGRCVRPETGDETDNLETLMVGTRQGAAAAVFGFFRQVVDDWIYRRADFSDPDGGAAETLIDRVMPPDRVDERGIFLDQLAGRLAGDFVTSAQLVASIEDGIRKDVQRALEERARLLANQTMVALEEARENSAQPELASQTHTLIADTRPREGSPRIHVRPQIKEAEVSAPAGADPATLDTENLDVGLHVTVLANPEEHPGPYAIDSLVFTPTPQDDGVMLSVRVTVRDATGAQVGEPVDAEVGFLEPVEPEEPPAVLADPVVYSCVLGSDTPAGFPLASAADYCDGSIDEAFAYDRVAVFFTPRIDLGDRPDKPDADGFVWYLEGPSETGRAGGWWFPAGAGGSTAEPSTRLARARAGSPGEFVFVPDLGKRIYEAESLEAARSAGAYTVHTASPMYDSSGDLLGRATGGFVANGEWQEEGSFTLADGRLHFKGFVTETRQPRPLSGVESDGVGWQGNIGPIRPQVSGMSVSMDLRASWRLTMRDAEGKQVADPQTQTAAAQLSLTFPETIDPGMRDVVKIDGRLEPGREGLAPTGETLGFVAGLNLLVPTDRAPPDRHLLRDDPAGPLTPAWTPQPGVDGPGVPRWVTEAGASGGEPLATGYDASVILIALGGLFGIPERTLPEHLRDPQTLWVIPVFTRLGSEGQTAVLPSPTSHSIISYAIYGREPGPYAGPLPAGDPPVVVAEDEPEAQEDPAEDAAEEKTDDVPVERLMPRVVGLTLDEALEALGRLGLVPRLLTGPPARSRDAAGKVESASHSAGMVIGDDERVTISIFTDFIERILVPDLADASMEEAIRRLEEAGLEFDPAVGPPAPTPGQEGTVERQNPPAGEPARAGQPVTVWIHTAYSEETDRATRATAAREAAAREAARQEAAARQAAAEEAARQEEREREEARREAERTNPPPDRQPPIREPNGPGRPTAIAVSIPRGSRISYGPVGAAVGEGGGASGDSYRIPLSPPGRVGTSGQRDVFFSFWWQDVRLGERSVTVAMNWSNEHTTWRDPNACKTPRWFVGAKVLEGFGITGGIGYATSEDRLASLFVEWDGSPDLMPEWAPELGETLLRQIEALARPCP